MLGKDLKKFRKSLKLTQAEFAEIVGVSRISVVHWERSRFRHRDDIFAKLRVAGYDFELPDNPEDKNITPAVLAYREARIIFEGDHIRSLRHANQLLHARNLPTFTRGDMNILFAEYPDILKS